MSELEDLPLGWGGEESLSRDAWVPQPRTPYTNVLSAVILDPTRQEVLLGRRKYRDAVQARHIGQITTPTIVLSVLKAAALLGMPDMTSAEQPYHAREIELGAGQQDNPATDALEQLLMRRLAMSGEALDGTFRATAHLVGHTIPREVVDTSVRPAQYEQVRIFTAAVCVGQGIEQIPSESASYELLWVPADTVREWQADYRIAQANTSHDYRSATFGALCLQEAVQALPAQLAAAPQG